MHPSWPVLLVAIMAGTAIGDARAGNLKTSYTRISYMEAHLLERTRLTPPASESETPVDFALRQWAKCVAQAADAMADQSEPASTVVEAAFRRCDKYEAAFRHMQPYKQEIIDKFKSEAMVPGLLDLVLSVRARDKLGR